MNSLDAQADVWGTQGWRLDVQHPRPEDRESRGLTLRRVELETSEPWVIVKEVLGGGRAGMSNTLVKGSEGCAE